MFYPNSAWWFYQPVLVFISVPLWFVVLLGEFGARYGDRTHLIPF